MATFQPDPFGAGEAGVRASALFSMDTKSHVALNGNAISISWISGPLSSAAQYMDDATIATLCGSHVCFSCTGVSRTEVFSPRAGGVSALVTNGSDLFAVTEKCLRPAVVVFQYPDLAEHSRLEDGAELEYICVVFAPSSERLAAFSGVPDYTVFLWDLNSQVMIAKLPVGFAKSPQLSFCDLDTPHLALTSEIGVTIIQMEHFGTECRLTRRTAELSRVRAHCWSVSGDLYCSQRDRIYQVSVDTMEVTELKADQWVSGTIVSLLLTTRGIFAAMDDGRILLCEPDGPHWSVQVAADMERPVQAMQPSPAYNFIAITCRTGQVRLLYIPSLDYKLLEGHELECTPAVDVCLVAPLYDHVVSVHDPHGLHVWVAESGRHVASVELVGRLTCVASSSTLPFVIAGNDESCLFAIDLVLPLSPRVIWTARISEAAVTSITVSQSGRVGVVLTADGAAYLMSTLPSAGFGIRAELETDGAPTAVDMFERTGADGSEDLIAVLVTSRAELLSFVRVLVVRDCEVVGSATYGLDTVYAGLALHNAASLIYTMSIQDRALCCFTLREPQQLMTEQVSDLLRKPDARAASGHELRDVRLRTVGRTVLSACDDGTIISRPDNLADTSKGLLSGRHHRRTHQPQCGGIRSFVLQPSGREAALVGHDGTLMHISLPYTRTDSTGQRRSTFFNDPTEPVESRHASAMRPLTSWDLMKVQPTWKQLVAEQAWRKHEDELVATRERIRGGVQALREKVKAMLDANAQMEEMDRLPENEFELDLDEQARLAEASDARVEQAKSAIIDENARNMYVRDQIKKQCWDAMDVKGKSIQGLMLDLEVANYPLLARSDDWTAILDGIEERRRLEVAEKQLQLEMLEPVQPAAPSSVASSLCSRVVAAGRRSLSTVPSPTSSQHAPPEEDVDSDEEGTPQQETAHTGSVSHQLSVTSPWLLSQFHITTRKQRVEQIYMLREVVYQLEVKFNNRFEEVYKTKCAEVQRFTDWAARLVHIYSELGMSEQPWVPQWTAAEKPETLLSVSDDEVTVERYYTPAERARMNAQAAEEERRRREREANDFRERALMQMMNGVLEVRWEDTLKEDVPRPEFMDATDQGEWTEDQVKEAAEYEQKVVVLKQEREKYRKMLEQELKKVLVAVQEAVDKFDQVLNQLFALKIQTEQAIDQEELKISRLMRDVAEEDHRAKREAELCRQVDEIQQRKVGLQSANAVLRRALEAAKAGHEPLVQHDRLLDRGFRKEFHDLTYNVVDVLYRYFSHMGGSGLRCAVAEVGVIEVDHRHHGHGHGRSRSRSHSRSRPHNQHGSKSPTGSHRLNSLWREPPAGETGGVSHTLAVPPSHHGHVQSMHDGTPYRDHLKTVPGKRAIMEAMKEVDDDSQRSEEIEQPAWVKMCRLRLEKVIVEFEIMRSSAGVAALSDSIEKRRYAEEGMAQHIQALISELAELRENRLRQIHDQEIQLVLRQGQVEIDLGDFCPNFDGSALIHRSRVEMLNKQILGIGDKKLEVMRDALRFRRGIVLQRWEYERCRMTLEDLVQQLKDIDFMKVTRAIQQYLADDGDTADKQIARLERRLEILSTEAYRKQEEDADAAGYLERLLRIKRNDNQRLALQARELNVDVSERELLYDIRCNHQRKWQARERLNNLRKIRDLCDVASFQQRYMAMLHGELQRKYSKTYPILHAI